MHFYTLFIYLFAITLVLVLLLSCHANAGNQRHVKGGALTKNVDIVQTAKKL